MEPTSSTPTHGPGNPEPPRRSFLTCAAAASLGAAVGLGPLAAGLYVALDPLRKRQSGEAPFIPVTPLEVVPADGQPRLFRVITSREDGWTRHTRTAVGAVYLRRSAEKPNEVVAFNPICPHLGCFVNTKPEGSFHCPCHDSTFHADGSLGPQSPSPRGLDRLETRIEDGKILVQFLNFEAGTKEKKPIL